jgi:DNA-binding protein HU-beta
MHTPQGGDEKKFSLATGRIRALLIKSSLWRRESADVRRARNSLGQRDQPTCRVHETRFSHFATTRGSVMSKAFLSQVLKESVDLTGAAANRAAGDLMDAIVKELKKSGKFTLPSFGTFTVRKTKARKGLNPRTGESIKVKAGKTVRFKASPTLKKAV